jgi:N-acyl-D-amino-acid deacylase
VKDEATYAAPHAYPTGMPHVLVNGVFVVKDGKTTGARPGQILGGPADPELSSHMKNEDLKLWNPGP